VYNSEKKGFSIVNELFDVLLTVAFYIAFVYAWLWEQVDVFMATKGWCGE